MIRMTRQVAFSAGLANWQSDLSLEDNRAVYGLDASPEPYGHNYVLDVTVAGEINPRTGIIVNIKEIDRIVRQCILSRLDRKLINRNIKAFRNRPITPENLTLWIAEELKKEIPGDVALISVRLEETALLASEWQASNTDMEMEKQTEQLRNEPGNQAVMRLTRVYEFAASHRLHSPYLTDEENVELFGKCNYPNGHGHNYILEVTVDGPVDERTGRVMHPDALDAIVNHEVVDRYDHRHFNYDIPEFKDLIPSTEVITQIIWQRLQNVIPAPARLVSVLIRETARNIFEYRGETNTI